MPSTNTEWKAEEAVKVWLATDSTLNGLAGGIVHGDATSEIVMPRIIVRAIGADEDPANSGNSRVDLQILLNFQRDAETEATLKDYWGRINDKIFYDALPSELSGGVTGFHCFGVIRNRSAEHDFKDRTAVKIFNLSVICCPTDL